MSESSLQSLALDLSTAFPRSPRETLGGYSTPAPPVRVAPTS